MAVSGKHWTDFTAKNVILPPAFDRQTKTSDSNTPFCVTIKSVDGIPNPHHDTPANISSEYQYSVCLYDGVYKHFFGRQWMSVTQGPKKDQHGFLKLTTQQNVYFHTSITDQSIMAVIEIIAMTTAHEGVTQKQSCGWVVVPVYSSLGESKDAANSFTLQAFNGSPRCLFYVDDVIQEKLSTNSVRVDVSVQLHRALLKVTHLLPENVLLGTNDLLPGLAESRQDPTHPSACADNLRKPKLLPKRPRQIDRLSITIPPNIDKFEEELCHCLYEDRTKVAVKVMERRLHVGVHNGWCYVETPQTVHLVSEGRERKLDGGVSPTVRRTSILAHKRQPSTGSNSSSSPASCLSIRNPIQISELVEDPLFAVVFTLEYIVGEQLSQDDRKMSQTLRRAQSRPVTLRWAAWSPFMGPHTQDVSLTLNGGPLENPNDTFVFKVPATEMQDQQASLVAPGQISLVWGDATHPPDHLTVPALTSQPRELDSASDEGLHYDPVFSKPPLTPRTPRSQIPAIHTPASHAQPVTSAVMGQYPSTQGQQMFYQPYPQGQVPPGMFPPMVPIPYVYQMPHHQSSSATTLAEIPQMPLNAPVVVATPHMTSGQSLTRSAYARLYSAGFPPLKDRHGDIPEVVHPQTQINVDVAKEMRDNLLTNEIVFQFLAFSRMEAGVAASKPSTVYFTFQFYRYPHVTTERLLMSKPQSDLTSDPENVPFILQRINSDGSLHTTSPGYEVRYYVDPSFLKPGEHGLFLRHLTEQTLHIDVWDGDSLLLIGSCSVELKYLCRQHIEAIQTTFELDVMTTEYNDEAPTMGPQTKPVGLNNIVQGRLHLRLANIGHSADDKTAHAPKPDVKPCVVMSQSVNQSTFPGGSLSTTPQTVSKRRNVARANRLVETNREVASLLFSQKTQAKTSDEREGDSERHRKIARMTAVRQIVDEQHGRPLTVMSYKQEKTERIRDLKTIDFYRQQTKRNGILTMLGQALGSEHTINPSFGSAEFFEFVLKNPYNVQQTVRIEFSDAELSVISDAREWRYFKHLHQITTPEEEGLVHMNQESDHPQVFLRPKEVVNIPFKFQTFKADHSVKPQGPMDPFKEPRIKTSPNDMDAHLESRVIKVYFKGEDGKPISLLLLNVDPQPHVVNQTFRFHHPENSFLKKSIRLPQLHSVPGLPLDGSEQNRIYVHCSDHNVICESRATQLSEPQDIFIKVSCGPSPKIKKFFLSVYTDQHMARPAQIWQFYVHSLQRIDMNAVQGQTTRVSLILKGTHSSRLVRCFSSHQSEMAVEPHDAFMLAANTVHEVNVAVCPLASTNKMFYVNVVDTEYHQLLRTWLICVNARAPLISRGFEINLPLGGGKGSNKRISFTNPYPQKRSFKLRCNRDDLVQFKAGSFDLEPGTSENIGLRFTPIFQQGSADILVFINDEDDKNEETFSIKATYAASPIDQ